MRYFKPKSIALVCLMAMLPMALGALEPAQGKGKGKKGKPGSEKKDDRETAMRVEFAVEFLIGANFSSKDARRYATEGRLGGQKPLPPGIRKNLARGKPIPPGIAKRNMPASFLKQLPSDPGYEWNMMGTDLVLVGKTDKLVKEVVKDVFK